MMFFHWQQLQIIVKSITLDRIWNYIKIVLSYRISLFIGKPVVWGMPYSLTIEPTNYCNLCCPECPSGLRILQRDQGNIEISLAKKIIADLGNHLFHINFYFQGEPFLHPEINSLFAEAKKKESAPSRRETRPRRSIESERARDRGRMSRPSSSARTATR